jgi:O-antigen ligase
MEKRNNNSNITLLQEKPVILFILFSIIPLFFSSHFSNFDFLLFSIVFLVITLVLFRESLWTREIKIFCFLLTLYGFWILISFLLHYKGLTDLDPTTYLSVTKESVGRGLHALKNTTQAYLLFPVLFFFSIFLLRSEKGSNRMLRILPLLVIPSLFVALYQGLFDISFLNHPYFIQLKRVSGLDHDSNAFGISLFLLMPLCILSFLIVRDSLKRILLTVLIIYVVWGLLLSGSLTGLTGVLVFLFLLPWVLVWADRSISSVKRKILILIPFVLAILLIILAASPLKRDVPFASVTLDRLHGAYEDYKEGGVEHILEKSGRLNLGYNAIQLTKLSPLSGWGPGGFLRNLQNARFRRGEWGFTFLIDNANNQYLQMSSELGILGGLLNLLIHILPIWMVVRIRKRIHDRTDRMSVSIVFSTVLIMMLLFVTGPHTVVASVLWIFVVLLSYLFVIALKYGYSFRRWVRFSTGSTAFVLLTLLFSVGTYNNVFGREGYISRHSADWWSLKYDKHCYPTEQFDRWVELRWCRKNSSLQIPLRRYSADRISFGFVLYHPDINKEPVKLRYGGKSGPQHEMVVHDNLIKSVELPLTEEHIYKFRRPDGIIKSYFVLSLDISRTWIPKEWNISDDTRELGVGVIFSVK